MHEKDGEACITYDFVIPHLDFQRAFYSNALKECIVLRLLQEMYRLGYDLVISAKMTSGLNEKARLLQQQNILCVLMF